MCSSTATFRFIAHDSGVADSAGTKYMHRGADITILELDNAFFNKWFPNSTNRRDNMITVYNSIFAGFNNTPLTVAAITCTVANWGGGNPRTEQPYVTKASRHFQTQQHGSCWYIYVNSGYLQKWKLACNVASNAIYEVFHRGLKSMFPIYLNDFCYRKRPIYYPRMWAKRREARERRMK